MIGETLLHCDWAGHDAPGWAIGEIDAQITWNIHCSVPESGGTTVVFDRPWRASAERHLVEGSYGYAPQAVAGADAVRLEPRAGDLVLFNSRNFHKVEPCVGGGDRISVSSFVGRLPGSGLIAWS
ncbi:2OG-Fe(II) oxygenase [Streptomyces sp. M19]